jgi:hypothetical protein
LSQVGRTAQGVFGDVLEKMGKCYEHPPVCFRPTDIVQFCQQLSQRENGGAMVPRRQKTAANLALPLHFGERQSQSSATVPMIERRRSTSASGSAVL